MAADTFTFYAVDVKGAFTVEEAAKRNRAEWTSRAGVVAASRLELEEELRDRFPSMTGFEILNERKPTWSNKPVVAAEIYQTKRAAAASAAGWKRRKDHQARVFNRAIRAGGHTIAVVVVIVRGPFQRRKAAANG